MQPYRTPTWSAPVGPGDAAAGGMSACRRSASAGARECDRSRCRLKATSRACAVGSVVHELNKATPAVSHHPGVRHKESHLPMQIHRSCPTDSFTVLPNALLQDRRLTYTARGLLCDLLSRPDGWREDGRRMADNSPQGRLAVSKALRELASFGYYRVDKVRQPDGTFISEAHVFDTPQQATPPLTRPGSGQAVADPCGSNPVKNRQKEPSLPAQRVDAQRRSSAADPTPDATDPGVREAVSTLFRVIRPEPRLRLGSQEAQRLAPLVAAWLERGCTEQDLAQALLPGLPAHVHSPASLLRDRLTRKLPATPEPVIPSKSRWSECGQCGDPVPHAGICRTCAGLGARVPDVGGGADATAHGIAKVRAAMRPVAGRLTPSRA